MWRETQKMSAFLIIIIVNNSTIWIVLLRISVSYFSMEKFPLDQFGLTIYRIGTKEMNWIFSSWCTKTYKETSEKSS